MEYPGKYQFKKIIIHVQQYLRRRNLISKDFTIISNNCSGGFVYNFMGLPYSSPTVGLWFSSDDFVKLISNFDVYVNHKLEFIDGVKEYPVAKLNDITIYFMHYTSQNEVKQKWNRRIKRINPNKTVFLMVETDDFKEEYLDMLNGKAIFLSYTRQFRKGIYIPQAKEEIEKKGYWTQKAVCQHVDIVEEINKRIK